MAKLENFLNSIRYTIVEETNFSKYHILWIILLVLVLAYLLIFHYNMSDKHFRIMLFVVGILYFIGEVLKILCACYYDGKMNFVIELIPWQFCSTPLYFTWITPLIKNNKVRQSFLTYLGTYCLIAGSAAFFNANSIFTDSAFSNFHTLFLHGGMITIALYILLTKRLDFKRSSFIGALCIFLAGTIIALSLNTYFKMTQPDAYIDLYFISPYTLSGPQIVQNLRTNNPYWLYFFGYMSAFTLAALIVFSIGKIIYKLNNKKQNKLKEAK